MTRKRAKVRHQEGEEAVEDGIIHSMDSQGLNTVDDYVKSRERKRSYL